MISHISPSNVNDFVFVFTTTENNNIIFLKGIDKLNSKVSKEFFRFSTIYNKENCQKIISQIKIQVPTYKASQLPQRLRSTPVSIPGSRFI